MTVGLVYCKLMLQFLSLFFKSKKNNNLPPIATVKFKFSSKEFRNSSNKFTLSTSPVQIIKQSPLYRRK